MAASSMNNLYQTSTLKVLAALFLGQFTLTGCAVKFNYSVKNNTDSTTTTTSTTDSESTDTTDPGVTYSYTLDPVEITDPEDDNSKVSYSGQAAWTIEGTCTTGNTVVLYGDVSATATCVGGAFSATIDFSDFADGAISIQATQQDSSNNRSTSAVTRVVTKDTAFCSVAANRTNPVASNGAGTVGDPYKICTADQLDDVRNDVNSAYQVKDDIDLTAAGITPWTEISFNDSFDGDNFTISNITTTHRGLFNSPVATGTSYSNVRLRGVNVTTNQSSSGCFIGGTNGTTTLTNISVRNCNFTSSNQWGAGIIGSNIGSQLIMSDVRVIDSNITVHNGSGGIIGWMNNGTSTIANSYVRNVTVTNVNTLNSIGGFFGEVSAGTIEDSYVLDSTVRCPTFQCDYIGGFGGISTAAVLNRVYTKNTTVTAFATAGWNAGGLIAILNGTSSATDVFVLGGSVTAPGAGLGATGGLFAGVTSTASVTRGYSSASVSAGSGPVGGVVGAHEGTSVELFSSGAVSGAAGTLRGLAGTNTGTITDSYWNMDTSGQATSAGGTGLTDAESQDSVNFSGWSFGVDWKMDATIHNYPVLFWQ